MKKTGHTNRLINGSDIKSLKIRMRSNGQTEGCWKPEHNFLLPPPAAAACSQQFSRQGAVHLEDA